MSDACVLLLNAVAVAGERWSKTSLVPDGLHPTCVVRRERTISRDSQFGVNEADRDTKTAFDGPSLTVRKGLNSLPADVASLKSKKGLM